MKGQHQELRKKHNISNNPEEGWINQGKISDSKFHNDTPRSANGYPQKDNKSNQNNREIQGHTKKACCQIRVIGAAIHMQA